MIKCVAFDLDNTVYDYDFCHGKAMEALETYACETYGLSGETFTTVFNRAKKKVKDRLGDTGASHNRMLYMQLFLENIGKKPADGALALYNVYWDTVLDHMGAFPYVFPLMEELKQRNIRIAVLTDLTAQIQHRKLARLGLPGYVDVLVTSEEAGREKPAAEPFGLLLKKLRLNPGEVLMIGDSYEKDIKGALRSGMDALLFEKSRMGDMEFMVMERINAE